MKNANISLLSFPNAVIGNLSLRKKRDPRYRTSGMTRGCTSGIARAFTLIELLVVVLIIGILSAIALPQYQKAVDKTLLVQIMTDGDALMAAEKVYYLANGKYTNQLNELDISLPGEVSVTGSKIDFNGGNCTIAYGTSLAADSIFCETAAYDKLWFCIFLDEYLTRYCVAESGDERAAYVCKSMTKAAVVTLSGNECYAL